MSAVAEPGPPGPECPALALEPERHRPCQCPGIGSHCEGPDGDREGLAVMGGGSDRPRQLARDWSYIAVSSPPILHPHPRAGSLIRVVAKAAGRQPVSDRKSVSTVGGVRWGRHLDPPRTGPRSNDVRAQPRLLHQGQHYWTDAQPSEVAVAPEVTYVTVVFSGNGENPLFSRHAHGGAGTPPARRIKILTHEGLHLTERSPGGPADDPGCLGLPASAAR